MSNLPARALIVDDDALARRALEDILARGGFFPVSVPDIRTALTQLDGGAPDLVIADLVLPDGSGIQLVEEIRRRPGLHRCAVIAISARREPAVVLAAFNAGADDFAAKPFAGEEFLARAQLAVRRRRELPVNSGRSERKDVAALFCDVRGFTAVAARLDPESVVELLNGLFERLVADVVLRGGVVDKFLGDGLLALFGMNDARNDNELRAVGAALAMVESTQAYTRESLVLDGRPLNVGIGIASGEVVVAPVGARTFRQVTAIGDSVNLASRLQGVAAEGEVLICPRTFSRIGEKVECGAAREVTLKGIAGTPRIHPVLALRPEAFLG
ncbi:MAG: response regulator [Myxococcaceae bacterium]